MPLASEGIEFLPRAPRRSSALCDSHTGGKESLLWIVKTGCLITADLCGFVL